MQKLFLLFALVASADAFVAAPRGVVAAHSRVSTDLAEQCRAAAPKMIIG